ncbi:MAG: NAD(+)--dinitrogen-reductase ADP-D-ribosyltransferase [Neptuniibacter sp.]
MPIDLLSAETELPGSVHLPINRCNYPATILGSHAFQEHPEPIHIDYVQAFHRYLFERLDAIESAVERALLFDEYMQVSFLLGHPDQIGLDENSQKVKRHKFDYKRLIRGWMFDSNGREGAVLKGWVETRFGLCARSHNGPLRNSGSGNYQQYLSDRSQGLYNTNGIESQLDLLYTYCQYELKRQDMEKYLTLYRGTNELKQYEHLFADNNKQRIVLLNNLNSFSDKKEYCDNFGDHVFRCKVPFCKLFFFPGLLPGLLKCENEHLVIGGLYSIKVL